jgi:predicted dithiol-disulfide oxidoreductase (DUF899 family)
MPARTGTREEWLEARRELLAAEKEHTRRSDELARLRRDLPWVRIDKDYRFESADGEVTLADLFRGRSQLIVLSSLGSDFGFDFGVAFTDEQIESGRAEHNIHSVWDWSDLEKPTGPYAKYDERPLKDLPGVSCFALEDGVVYHTYSAYARGTDVLWGMYQWLDRAPLGRNESGPWFRVRDEYEDA